MEKQSKEVKESLLGTKFVAVELKHLSGFNA